MKNDLINTAQALPICILRDSVKDGKRTNKFAHYNELFRPNPKPLAKRAGGELGGSVFTPYHYHEGLEILRITEGKCLAVINKKSYTAKSGDILIVNPFEAHGIYLECETAAFSRDCISFLPDRLFPESSILEFMKNATFENLLSGSAKAHASLAIDKIIASSEGGAVGWELSALAGIMDLYSAATRHGACAYERSEQPSRMEFMMRVSSYVDANLSYDISTADAAAFCKYSPEHFCRLFKKSFNTTFLDYLNAYRTHKAKEYVDRGHATSVAELALKFGFLNQNHFGNMFKKYIGTLPSVYIKEKRRGAKKI